MIRRAISVPIFMVLMFILLVAVIVPAYLFMSSTQIYSNQGSQQATGYLEGQTQEVNQVFRGNPNVYYNSSKSPYLQVLFTSIPYPLNATQIYYYNGTTWSPVLKGSLVVAGNTFIPLPSKAFNKPIIMVSGEGNVYFLNPNTSINTVNVQGPAGKLPVYIASFVENGSKFIPVSVQVIFPTTGSSSITPQVYYVTPGTYPLTDKNQTVFLPQYGLTGTFQNWSIVGGTLSATNQLSTSVTVFSATVITAIYKAQTTKYEVQIVPKNIPLAPNVTILKRHSLLSLSLSNLSLSSLNKTIPVKIDNKTYLLNSSGIKLNLTYGYHLIQFPSYYNISFNYTSETLLKKILGKFFMYAGEINCYEFNGLSSPNSNVSIKGTDIVFVNGSGKVYGIYTQSSVYYAMLVNNSFSFPSGVSCISCRPSVIGDIAGQLIQVNNSFVIGPTTNNGVERLYFKNGTTIYFTKVYLYGPFSGQFQILDQNNPESFSQLLSNPCYIKVDYPLGTYLDYPLGTYSFNPPYSFNMNYPYYITDVQQWEYGGYEL
ncbi:hypothetical protein DFR88_10060 [Metallosphaera sedula]|uniref:Uncharacterized protein n=1 Tax=Metallosphaera prunae TaxID=47304 RepID=A0A4D8S7K4_METPR|nr:hypothetical protein [Metallosphaera prunae]QCO30785.1 hypothetical protein DFR88_10060 [Metallosphaera prunae]